MNDTKKAWYERLIPSWPSTWPASIFGSIFVITLAGLIVYFSYNQSARQGLFEIATFNDRGAIDTNVETLYIFSTPSWLTKYDMAQLDTTNTSFEEKLNRVKIDSPWYFVDDPTVTDCSSLSIPRECLGQQVSDFITKLDQKKSLDLLKRIQGYEFYESIGSGSQPAKRSLTWKITIPIGSTFDREDLITLYVEHWRRPSGIYIEEYKVRRSKMTN